MDGPLKDIKGDPDGVALRFAVLVEFAAAVSAGNHTLACHTEVALTVPANRARQGIPARQLGILRHWGRLYSVNLPVMNSMTPDYREEENMRNILLVEDNITVAKVLASMLCSSGGYETEVYESAEDALLSVQDEQPELMLIDVGLPGHNGIWLARKVHEKWPDLPMLIVSGYAYPAYKEQALEAGARGYVLKDDVTGILEGIRAAFRGETYVSPQLRGDEPPPEYPGFPNIEP